MTMLKIAAMVATLVMFFTGIAAGQPVRPAESSRTVTLSLTEYNRLTDLANQPAPTPAPAPVASVLASASLRVRVERDIARGVFDLAGEVLRPGVSRVTLLNGATLVDASAGGRALPLIADGNSHAALLPGPGPFALTLEWGTPLRFVPGRASFVLPVPPSGTARAVIDVPGDLADVHVSSGLVTRRTTSGGRTIVEATLDPGSPTEVWWSMRDSVPVAAAREVRTLADVMTLITLGDSDIRLVALVDVSVVQGDLRTIEINLPSGYELTGLTGNSLETSEPRDRGLLLSLSDPTARRHQFLISLERSHQGGSFTLDTGVPTLPTVGRERGEIAVEGVGTLDLNAAERDGMHRIDVRELNQALQSLARQPVLSAFRYQRTATLAPGLALDVRRFADVGVLAAVADYAMATTLVTTEGRALTEVTLQVRNRAQPFLKVTLPAGAAILSVDLAGTPAKPVLGVDGTRVPLLRPGFRPRGPYSVSFVYMHAGTPFARKGELQMTIPKMDVPVGVVWWEVFAPSDYSMRAVDGNVIDQQTLTRIMSRQTRANASPSFGRWPFGSRVSRALPSNGVIVKPDPSAARRQISGRAVDLTGALLPGVAIQLETAGSSATVHTKGDGSFVFPDVPPGPASLTATLAGFQSLRYTFVMSTDPQQLEFIMEVSGMAETITVTGASPAPNDERKSVQPSQNVINLQRRVAGVLPVRVDVPRTGSSHEFVKSLVVDQETVVRFRYKRR
jgi:hypothetical protein